MLSDEHKQIVSCDVEVIRNIAQHISETTNIKNFLIYDIANVIYLKMSIKKEI